MKGGDMLAIVTHICNTNTLEVEASLDYRVKFNLRKQNKPL